MIPLIGWSFWKREDNREAYRRTDGAVVLWDDRSPYPNPIAARNRMWTAWEPDPSTKYLSMRRSEASMYTFPRRWGTAKSAMKAVDREYPQIATGNPASQEPASSVPSEAPK